MSVNLKDQYDKIYRFCYLRVRNRETAEDLTQETFLRFLEHPQYNSNGKAMQYLYTIARNLCIDEYRKKTEESIQEEVADDSIEENKWIDHIALRQVFRTLPEEDREIILLHYINDVPVSVISNIFNVSRFAMYRRINKILAVLRNEFEKEGSE